MVKNYKVPADAVVITLVETPSRPQGQGRRDVQRDAGEPRIAVTVRPTRAQSALPGEFPCRGMMADLGGKAALVTGAASGIGFATVEMFARRGAKVALNHLPDDRARAAPRSRGCARRASTVIGAPGDVSKPGAAENMVRDAIEALGRLDYLANNAGTLGDRRADPARRHGQAHRGVLGDHPHHQPDRPVPLHACGGGRAQGRAAARSATPPRSPASTWRARAWPMARARPASSA